MALTEADIIRYGRQIIVPEVGGAGQEKLLASHAVVIGAGGLGSPSLLYLAAAGVGHITVIDGDVVDETNLQRQIAHTTADLGVNKAVSAAETMLAINPGIDVTAIPERVNAENIGSLIADADVVLDGSDNFATRYLVNDACVLARKSLVEAAILRFHGQLLTVLPGSGPCYRCLFPAQPEPGSVPSCSQAGILGPVAGVMGSLQAAEALKLLIGADTLVGRALFVDVLSMDMRTFEMPRDPGCPVCGDDPVITEALYEELGCGLPGAGAS
ncbi:MAG: HesA/MoeB/ThiF family protein [Actinobacteria bacterium]|nr:HesA/MoeB/ThiF family protein [Actinomycetota bacterium]